MSIDTINGEDNNKFYKSSEWEFNKNLFAKVLYTSLFDWLVSKFNTIIKVNNSPNARSKSSYIERFSKTSLDTYNKYKDENEIKDLEKEDDKENNVIDNEIRHDKKIISTKFNKNIKDSLNLNNSINEDKSKEDLFKDVYDIKTKRMIVDDIPHTTSVLISPGFLQQCWESLPKSIDIL